MRTGFCEDFAVIFLIKEGRMCKFGFLVAVLIAIDQYVKAWTVANIELDSVRKILPGFMSLAHFRNYGAAWSILQNQQWF